MAIYEPSEILEFAVAIERNGEAFYRKAMDSANDDETRNTFHFLAVEEVKHERLFSDMLKNIETYQPAESYPEEYFTYLRAFVENIIFPAVELSDQLTQVEDPLSAIRFAQRRELDSILYYEESKKFVAPDKHETLERIIGEERAHYLLLVEAEKRLIGSE